LTPTVTGTPTPTGPATATLPPEPYEVVVGVYNAAGELVKQILVEHSPAEVTSVDLTPGSGITSLLGPGGAVSIYWNGSLLCAWDGTNSPGHPVSNGAYFLKVDSIDSLGSDLSVVKTVTVSRAFGTVLAEICNETGEVVRTLYDQEGPGGPVTAIQLSSAVLKPGSDTPGPVTIGMNNGVTLTWDGTGSGGATVTNGVYYLEVYSSIGTASVETLTDRLTVINGGKAGAMVLAFPNPWAKGDPPLTFKVFPPQAVTLKIRLYDLAGEKAADFEGSTGAGQAFWDPGTLASGTYIALVESRDLNGNLTARQTLKVALKR
jgi:flagellar hook assembly protein FlgD